ncbi:MAG: efflux RND transporter periplasmic adaptor subunit [Chloroflexota bacterium]
MKRIRLVAIIVVAVIIIATGIWWAVKSVSSETSSDILSSGFIEADVVTIGFETGGRIVDIAADEGDQITAGVTLVKLDDSLLNAQRQQLEASLQLAQANLEQALVSQEGAQTTWEDAVIERAHNIASAQAQVDSAREILANFETAMGFAGQGSNYDRLASVLTAQGQLAQAELNLEFQTTNVTVDRAYTAYLVAGAAVKASEKQVAQVEASLKVIDVQLSNLTTSSPVSGVVSAKNAEVGEVAKPGVPILTITELEEVTLTTYIPESKIGLVKLGQGAIVSVDSYTGDSFSGEVVYISPQAQFTPRNVQLKEEREKTVFAVKIRLDNPEQKLKPGMPADARIVTSPEG